MDELVDPDQLRRMAAIVLDDALDAKLRAVAATVLARPIEDIEAERARVREKLMSEGPHEPAPRQPGVESEAMARLREKLLRDVPAITQPARA